MPRIRTIKPEFPQSESMGKVSRESRLLFVLLWTIADDAGRTRAASRMLASLLFPYDNDAPDLIDGWLAELEREDCVIRYEATDGAHYLQVCNWTQHQKIDRPSESKIPPPRERSRKPRERSSLDLDQGPRTKDQGPGDQGARAKPRVGLAVARPDVVSEELWSDFDKLRRAKRAPLTPSAWTKIESEVAKAGWTIDRALTECVSRGWAGFKADWVAEGRNGAAKPADGFRPLKTIPKGYYSEDASEGTVNAL